MSVLYQIEMDDQGKALLLTLRQLCSQVYETLGKGYPEAVYQRALGVELQYKFLNYDSEITMSIPYKGHVVGQVRADLIVRGDTPVVIETKATAAALKIEERWQLSRYMKIQDIQLGCLVNFPQTEKAGQPQIEFFVLADREVLQYNIDTGEAGAF